MELIKRSGSNEAMVWLSEWTNLDNFFEELQRIWNSMNQIKAEASSELISLLPFEASLEAEPTENLFIDRKNIDLSQSWIKRHVCVDIYNYIVITSLFLFLELQMSHQNVFW